MGKLDFGALKEVQEDLSRRGSGDGLFVNPSELGPETDFRITEPKENLNGMYFLEVHVWWIGKKKLVSLSTFGKPDVIQEEVDEALESKDKELVALAKDGQKCKKKSEFWIPGLILKCEFDKDELVDCAVVDDKVKVLQAGPMLMKRINKVVTSRKAQNGTDEGITNRTKGFNLIISKTGKGIDTEYDAELGDQWEFPDKYYTDKAIPDILKMVKDSIKSEDYQRGVIRNYLYGEKMPKDEKPEDKDDDDDRKSSKRKNDDEDEKPRRRGSDDDDKPRRRSSDDEDDKPKRRRGGDEEEEKTSSRRRQSDDEDEKPKKKTEEGAPRKRNVLSDLNDLD